MKDLQKLDYHAESPRGRRRWIAGLAITLAVIPVLIYLLFDLQRAPYRPPYDMSTFLGGSEIAAVRMMMGVLAVAWFGIAAALIWLLLRERRPA